MFAGLLVIERADRARLRKERQELEMMIANGEDVDPELVLSLRKEEANREYEEKAKEKETVTKKELIPGYVLWSFLISLLIVLKELS